MIHVIATIRLAPGTRAKFLEEFHQIVPAVLAEDGCLAYGPTTEVSTNIPAQEALGEDAVVVVEQWEDLDCLERHLVAPHMVEYRGKVKDFVLGADLKILEPA